MGGGNSGTGRREVVLGQFDHAGEVARVRLAGLGDEEYRGEPVPGRWSVRRREEAVTPRAYGPGEWVLGLGAPDIPASEYAEVARQAASGTTAARIADDWSVGVERVEEVLAGAAPAVTGPAPVTTIAWRLGHPHSCRAGAWEWAFGERRRDPRRMVDFSPHAAPALDRFRETVDRWRAGVASVADEQLDTVGFSRYPYGSHSEDGFVDVPAGADLQFIHHMAEIALLRDLWRARG
jgi:hypothetical protein